MRYFKYVYHNFPQERLVEKAKKEGHELTDNGVLTMNTGKFTGRSPKDRYFVDDFYSQQKVDFTRQINQKISLQTFRDLKHGIINKLSETPTYLSDKFAGHSKKIERIYFIFIKSITYHFQHID